MWVGEFTCRSSCPLVSAHWITSHAGHSEMTEMWIGGLNYHRYARRNCQSANQWGTTAAVPGSQPLRRRCHPHPRLHSTSDVHYLSLTYELLMFCPRLISSNYRLLHAIGLFMLNQLNNLFRSANRRLAPHLISSDTHPLVCNCVSSAINCLNSNNNQFKWFHANWHRFCSAPSAVDKTSQNCYFPGTRGRTNNCWHSADLFPGDMRWLSGWVFSQTTITLPDRSPFVRNSESLVAPHGLRSGVGTLLTLTSLIHPSLYITAPPDKILLICISWTGST